jgi:tetratricopeptide (TPR) repeat protein
VAFFVARDWRNKESLAPSRIVVQMKRSLEYLLLLAVVGLTSAMGQQPTATPQDKMDPTMRPSSEPPRSDPSARGGSDSSSKDRDTDISPPADDAKDHPGSEDVNIDDANGVTEMKPWNPHQADKDVEIGQYYFKQSNFRAAESRFREALYWQDNHAEATYRLGTALERLKRPAEARYYYLRYLKVLPGGPFANDCRKALDRLATTESSNKSAAKSTSRP